LLPIKRSLTAIKVKYVVNEKHQNNHLDDGQWEEFEIKRFALSVISGSSHVVAHIMVTGDLHGR
jgi:hypothetical protein